MKIQGIHYEHFRCKSNHNKTVVLLHGLTGNTSRWETYIPQLVKEYNVIVIDLIGHGTSDYPNSLNKYSFDLQAEKIEKILIYEHISNTVLISHSFSSQIALALLQRDSGLFQKAIFISPYRQFHNKFFNFLAISVVRFLICFWPLCKHATSSQNYLSSHTTSPLSIYREINNIGIKSYLACLYCLLTYTNKDTEVRLPACILHTKRESVAFFDKLFSSIEKHAVREKSHLFLIKDREKILSIIKVFLNII